MLNFEFFTPTKMIFGKDTHKRVGEVIKSYGFHKIMLHYGGGSIQKNGVYEQVTASLKDAGIDYLDFGGAEPNPKLELVEKAYRFTDLSVSIYIVK